MKSILSVLKAAEENDVGAVFLKNLVGNFNRKNPIYEDITIRECLMRRNCSPTGYEYTSRNPLLVLPC